MTAGTVFLATIIVTAPEFGVAIVTSSEGTPETKNLFLAHLPLNDAKAGAISQANLVEGTTVVCLKNDNSRNKAYILGPANYLIGDIKDTTYGRAMYNVTDMAENQSTAFITALENLLQGSSIDFQNFAHGADRDAIPGDTDIVDVNGNAGLHIGRYLAQLRGSPAAFIDVSNITNAIRMIATETQQHLPLSVILAGKELHVTDIAINEQEAFGVQEQPLTISDNTVTYTDENAIPLYRIQEIKGGAADGKESLIVGFPEEGTHYCTTEPPILAKERTALDGHLDKASALSITSIKSPEIRGLHQVNYDPSRDVTEQTDILQEYEYQEDTEEKVEASSLSDEIDDAAINKLLDKLFTGDYLEKLKEKLASVGLKVSSVENTLSRDIEENGEEAPQPPTDQELPLPKFLKLTDPVSGKEATYFMSTSFISQEADGSILICDGYGSEIRMSRGNIYISPALDLFLRPGRDLSAMVPRHQSYNAQKTTTINSKESVYIRAVKDLKMAGATGGDGMVTLECDATKNTKLSGLLLRSTSGVTMTGHDVYIGINSGVGTTDSRIEERDRGTIIIDACEKGSISMRSYEQMIDSKTVCILADTSAIVVNANDIHLLTRFVSTTASLNIITQKEPTKVTVLRDGEPTEITLSYPSANPGLVVEGSLLVGANFVCNMSGKFCGGLTAKGIGSTSPFCGVVSYKFGDPFLPTEIVKSQAVPDVGVNTANALDTLSDTIYQDSYVSSNSFSFPEDYNVAANIRVPGMLWQEDAEGIWEEPPMLAPDGETITMCYPGVKTWQQATISTRGYKLKNLNTGYTTNA